MATLKRYRFGLISFGILMTLATAANAWQTPYHGASGAIYYKNYVSLTPAEQEDTRRFDDLATARMRTNVTPVSQPIQPSINAVPSTPQPVQPVVVTIQDQAGAASVKLELTTLALTTQIQTTKQLLLQTISAHERAPEIKIVAESERLQLFSRMLAEVIRLGNQAYENESKLIAMFAEWRKASGESAPVFRKAEAHFQQLARNESFARAKEIYEKASKWYGARAARCELRAQMSKPENVEQERQHIKALVKSCKELQSFIEKDPHYLRDPNGDDADFKAIRQAFTAVNLVLDTWTTKLVEDMQAEQKTSL